MRGSIATRIGARSERLRTFVSELWRTSRREPFWLSRRRILKFFPRYANAASRFGENNSRFLRYGNFNITHSNCERFSERISGKRPKIRKFPVIFPVSREFVLADQFARTAS